MAFNFNFFAHFFRAAGRATARSLRRTQLCCYCFRRYPRGTSPYRCKITSCVNAQPVDPIIAAEWPMLTTEERGVVIPPPGKKHRGDVLCTACKQRVQIRICPHCHHRFPTDYESTDHQVIALVGAKYSGKTHVIASTVHEMNVTLSDQTKMYMMPLDDHTSNRYEADYRTPLFGDGTPNSGSKTLAVTEPAEMAMSPTRLPLLYSLTQQMGRRSNRLSAVTIALFDSAGEDVVDRDRMESINRYIAEASGVIVLFDPIQVERLRQRIPNAPIARPVPTTSSILNRIIGTIRVARRVKGNRKINVPIAVAVSKVDELKGAVEDPNSYSIFDQPDVGTTFDRDAADRVSDEVQTILLRHGAEEVVRSLENNVARFKFFGLTATGSRPDGAGRFPFVKPNRVADPLLWMLFEVGFLRAKPRGKRAAGGGL